MNYSFQTDHIFQFMQCCRLKRRKAKYRKYVNRDLIYLFASISFASMNVHGTRDFHWILLFNTLDIFYFGFGYSPSTFFPSIFPVSDIVWVNFDNIAVPLNSKLFQLLLWILNEGLITSKSNTDIIECVK